MRWQHARGSFEIKDRPLLMGILNVTPDSFSDGGCFLEKDRAVEHGLKLLAEGASILDIGGESTRPGAFPLTVKEELERVLPVIEGILHYSPQAVLSVDTYKAETARQAMASGVAVINDVGGLDWDPEMLGVVLESGAGYIGMHSQGKPVAMQKNPQYGNVVAEVGNFLSDLKGKFVAAGMDEERLVLDVGIGFGKNADHNLALLKAGGRWKDLGRPMAWGVSRKSFISRVLNTENRLMGSLAIHARLRAGGLPQIWRVHEVGEMKQFLEMWELLAQA